MTFVRFSILFAAILSCFSSITVAQIRTPKQSGKLHSRKTVAPTPINLRDQAFEEVAKAVSLMCFDEEVCGKKWDDLKERYKPLVPFVKNDEELHILLQRMLNELNTSHFRIVPKTFEDRKEAQPWGIGVDLAIVDSRLLIRKVHPGSPAERANLRPGYAITKIDDKDVDQLISKYKTNPLWGGKNWKITLNLIIHSYFLNGPQDTVVDVRFLDEKDTPQQIQLERKFKHQAQKIVEHTVLEGRIGYIKLGVFDLTSMPEFCAAVRSMSEAPGIILDLRGNPGGITTMTPAIVGLLSSKPVNLGRMFKKNAASWDPFAEDVLESYPQVKPYGGRLVVLINEASGSSSEILAAGLRENGRAVIVGERSMGEVMPSMALPLPTGAYLQLAVSEFETANGVKLEGKGITPDVTVRNTRNGLLADTDEQLGAATDLIKKGEIFNTLKPVEGKPAVKEVAAADDGARDVSAPVRDAEVENILDKYTSAIGGKAAIEKLHSRVVTGTVKNSITGANGKFTIYDELPDKRMMIVRYEDGTIDQTAFNGPDVWTFNSRLGFRKLEGGQASVRERKITPYPALDPALSFKRKYRQLHYLQQTSAENHAGLLIGAGNGTDEDPISDYFTFDKKTGLLIKGVFQYEDYRVVNNVRVPFSVKVPNVIVYTVDQVSHNVEIPEGTFEKPVASCFTAPGSGC
jgi:carboxyl-terminal processing protease